MRARRVLTRVALVAIGCGVVGCATLASSGDGAANLPSTLSGPFRSLVNDYSCDAEEICSGINELPPGTSDGIAHYPTSLGLAGPSALVRGDQHVVLYATREQAGIAPRVVRLESTDARTFSGATEVVNLDQPYEGDAIADAAAVDVTIAGAPSVWIFYAVKQGSSKLGVTPGIARARSTDGSVGAVFEKDGAVVFDASGTKGAWETEPPRAPSVVQLDDGTFRMFFASGRAIGEASSADGAHFDRVDADPSTPEIDPVFVASQPATPMPFDAGSVDDPCVDRVVTPAGRVLYRMLFTGRDGAGGVAVGYAGRYGDAGAFDRAEGPVFGNKVHAHAPAIARFDGYALLYPDQDENSEVQIGVAITPTTLRLPFVAPTK
ncbi:MAG: hypothetical protein ACHREM_18330 [Polyangiales bacterium]